MINSNGCSTQSHKIYSYRLKTLIFDIIMVAWIPVAGLYLTYFALSRDLEVELKLVLIGFNLLMALPIIFVVLKTKHKIIISENGIMQKKLISSTFIAWPDIASVEYDTIVSSFSQSRFSKPKDLIIRSKHGDIVYVMDSLDGFGEVKELLAAKGCIEE